MKTSAKPRNKKAVDAVINDITASTYKLIGGIITWNARSDTTHKYQDVVNALQKSGLEEKVARELLPRFAFSRAVKKLEEERLIDVLKEDGDWIFFQFTRKKIEGATRDEREWKFFKETVVKLHKDNGTIECPIKDIQSYCQKELDRCMTERTTGDITKIVQKLFDLESEQNLTGDLMPIRDQGGAYFVSKENLPFVDKVREFLVNNLGGKLRLFPIPEGLAAGDASVQDTVAEYLNSLITQYNDAVEAFNISTRSDTMENVTDRIKKLRIKIEAYVSYLGSRKDSLKEELDTLNTKLKNKVEKILADKVDSEIAGTNTREKIYGQPVTSVIRWMGKEGWDFSKAKQALANKGVHVADSTIRAQTLAGRKGERGDPAKLTKEQAKELAKGL